MGEARLTEKNFSKVGQQHWFTGLGKYGIILRQYIRYSNCLTFSNLTFQEQLTEKWKTAVEKYKPTDPTVSLNVKDLPVDVSYIVFQC